MVKKSDLSASKAAAKAAKKAKQEKKANKTADKLASKAKQKSAAPAAASTSGKQSKAARAAAAAKAVKQEEDDLDALLASFRDRWAEEHAVHEERIATAPSRRANATLVACPGGDDLWLFGGEYFDGDKATFFADLYRYTPGSNASDAGVWRSYSSPNQPGPRSAHAIAPFPGSGGQLFLFGGEFASAKQTSFHHYRDLWIFHIATKVWERIDTKVRPSARSGHRMACWKQYIVLFGGFQDTGQRTTYLGDLWIFDTTEYKWHEVKQNELKKPAARSGFSLLPTPEGVVLHGGYCKRYVKGQRTQGVALEDTWLLTLDPGPDGEIFKSGKIEWTRRRKIGYAPGQRSGCTMALWSAKNMGALFGGVTDTEADEESMESTCHADLFGYQLGGTGRWISLNLKRPKKKGGRRRKKAVAQPTQRTGPQGSDDEDDSDAEGSDDERPNPANTAVSLPTPPATVQEDEDDPDDPQKSVPLGRYNAMLAIQRNILYCYGGIHETSNREYTLDDFYTLDLSKMERFHCLKACPVDALEWNESDDDSSTAGGSGSDSDSDDEEEEAGEAEQEGVEYTGGDSDEELEAALLDAPTESLEALKLAKAEKEELRRQATAFIGVSKDAARTEADVLSTPLPGESLRVFYERSKSYWAAKAHDASEGAARGKEMRTEGFAMAQNAYTEYEPILKEIERIQAEAGLDADEMKAAKGGGIAGGGAGADSRNRR